MKAAASKGKPSKPTLMERCAKVFGEAAVKRLEQTGRDFGEGARYGSYVEDEKGKDYIDCVCGDGIYNLGRRNEELLDELELAAAAVDQGNFPIISEQKAILAKALAEFVGGDLECSVFSVARGEAMEFACKVARGFTGRSELISVEGSFFGHTGFSLSLSSLDGKEKFGPLIPDVLTIKAENMEFAAEMITKRTAAVVLELVQAENGCRELSRGFVEGVAKLCKSAGALLVIDETQTGFGRTGRKFAYESYDVKPDVLGYGEALGGGVFPICGTIITQRVNEFMNARPMIHLSTFGGSDVGCMVASKALSLYEWERPWVNAQSMSVRLIEGLERISRKSGSLLRGVSGKGLLLSLSLPTTDKAAAFVRACAKNGLLVSQGKIAKNCVIIRPSLLLSEDEADHILAAVDLSCKSLK